jgi:VIT1/CCC1 family predicted Fe2+/Mn2+ transporter
MPDAASGLARSGDHGHSYEPHVGGTRQYWRDMVLGVNDGLVSVFLLVVGVVGGGLDSNQILLTAIAASVGGAVSMGAGEFLATQSQEQVVDSELALERSHIEHFRGSGVDQLRIFFTEMGVHGEDLDPAVKAFTSDDNVLLNAMRALEFGIVDGERRSPYKAMVVSSGLFLLGSLPSAVPFLLIDDVGLALRVATSATAPSLFAVAALKTLVTRTNPMTSGAQNLVITPIGASVAFFVGVLVDAQVG